VRNVLTGLFAGDRVNMDNAISIGTAIHKQLTEKKFGDITTKRSQQAQTFSIMRKSVKVDGDDVVNGKSFGGPTPSQDQKTVTIRDLQ
jgi:hypothetical protein